jgi:hypothetical protein
MEFSSSQWNSKMLEKLCGIILMADWIGSNDEIITNQCFSPNNDLNRSHTEWDDDNVQSALNSSWINHFLEVWEGNILLWEGFGRGTCVRHNFEWVKRVNLTQFDTKMILLNCHSCHSDIPF